MAKNVQEVATIPTSLTDVATIDFEKVFITAVEILSDQAMLNKDPSQVDLKELETSRARADNLLSAIGGVIKISHQVDIISAERDKFKRSDELNILNSLRRSCEDSALALEDNAKLARERLTEMMEDPKDVKPEEISSVQDVLHSNIDAGQKLIGSISRLIQLERMSGNRPWGNDSSSSMSISLIEGLGEKGKGGKGKKGPIRELSPEEVYAASDD